MQMIDVLKRLAELDDANGGIKESTKMIQDPTVAVINESTVQECGPMGMPGMASPSTPASFSVNATAASGDEVANMLTQILTLAGVKKDGPEMEPMGGHEHPLTGEPPEKSAGDDMKAAIQAIDQAEQETASLGGDMDGPEMETDMDPTDGAMGGEEPAPVSDMAQDVQDMADELADKDKEDLGLESFDNAPAVQTRKSDPLNDFAQIINKVREFEYTPPNSGSNPMKAEGVETPVKESTGIVDLTTQLFQEYQAFKAQ